jgi:hypothetical protein
MTYTGNLLSEYEEIISTYLIGLRAKLDANYTFYIYPEGGRVTFIRDIARPNLKSIHLSVSYTFDKETLELIEPSAEILKVMICALNCTVTRSLLRFSNQFFQDRYDDIPFTSNIMLEMVDKDGHTKLISADDLNWSFLHK